MTSLFDGPDLRAGAEPLAGHQRRLGHLPPAHSDLIASLERSGLVGRGGAGFPVGAKWRSLASARRGGSPVVLANGAEGEPLSRKDQALMACRPHLVLDGALLAAGAVGAGRIVLYVGEAHDAAGQALRRALAERPSAQRRRFELLAAPARYVAGEESAAVHFVNQRVAMPTSTPPRVFERGVEGRPTLVQNVESLAHAALIARFGDDWFRALGRGAASGTVLVTVSGAVAAPGVIEVPAGTTIAEAISLAGGAVEPLRAVLVGGYFGAWMGWADAQSLAIDPNATRLGCGVLWALPESASPVIATARIARHLANESAAQCGPCFFGLRAMADAWERLASGAARAEDVSRLERWSASIPGRGACRHPDGAAGMVGSALRVFSRELRGLEVAAGRVAA